MGEEVGKAINGTPHSLEVRLQGGGCSVIDFRTHADTWQRLGKRPASMQKIATRCLTKSHALRWVQAKSIKRCVGVQEIALVSRNIRAIRQKCIIKACSVEHEIVWSLFKCGPHCRQRQIRADWPPFGPKCWAIYIVSIGFQLFLLIKIQSAATYQWHSRYKLSMAIRRIVTSNASECDPDNLTWQFYVERST